MKSFLNLLKRPLGWVVKGEMLAFGVSAKTGLLAGSFILPRKTWQKARDAHLRFQMTQLHAFGRMKILDSEFVGEASEGYFRDYMLFNYDLPKRLDMVLKWNKDGALDEVYTCRNLHSIANTLKRLDDRYISLTSEQIDQSWKKIVHWIDEQAPEMVKNKGFAAWALIVLNESPVAAGKTPGGIIIPPSLPKRYGGDGRLCLIFNEKVTGKKEPLVVYCLETYTAIRGDKLEPLSRAIADLEKYSPSSFNEAARKEITANIKDTVKFLKDYQRKHAVSSI